MQQNFSGQTLGQYELRERIGHGGMAEVYRAYQASLDREVAVKIMLGHLTRDATFIERFRREAQSVARLRHPHILQVHDFGVENDIYFMVMEYIGGDTLHDYIVEKRQIPVNASLQITSQIADALHYAHQQGMIHRDLKPGNIMFMDAEHTHAILTDFGIARLAGQSHLTMSGSIVGTPHYISPESGRGEEIDERSDLYSLGVILFEMLTGKVPYDAETPLAVVMKHISNPIPTRADLGSHVPDSVAEIVFTALAKNPGNRFQNALQMKDAAVQALQSLGEKPIYHVHDQSTEVELPTLVDELSSGSLRLQNLDNTPTALIQTQPSASSPPPPSEPPSSSGGNNRLPLFAGIGVIIALIAVFVLLQGDEPETPLASATPDLGLSATALGVLLSTQEAQTITAVAQVVTETQTVFPSPTETESPTEMQSETPTETGTLAPTRRVTSTPATPILQARLDDIPIRAVPLLDAPVARTLQRDDQLEIIGISEDGRWLEVFLPDGTNGWILFSSTFVDVFGDESVMRVVQAPTNTPTDTPTATATNTRTPTATFTPSDTPTRTPSPTDTATDTPTRTPNPTDTPTDTPTITPSPTNTATDTPTRTPSPTDTATNTPSPTNTATNTPTITPSPTDTATDTPTITPNPTVTATDTPTITPSPTVTATDTPTITPNPTDTATITPSPTDTATNTPTITPSPTSTPIPDLQVIDVNNVTRIQEIDHLGQGSIFSMKYSPDNRWLAIGSSIGLWLYDNNQLNNPVLFAHPESVTGFTFSADSSQVTLLGRNGAIATWDIDRQFQIATEKISDEFRENLIVTNYGGYFVITSNQRLVELGTDLSQATALDLEHPIGTELSPDQSIMATGDESGNIHLWDVATGNELQVLSGHTDELREIAFHPNGNILVTGGLDQTVRVWDIATGQNITTLTAHTDRVLSIAFHQNGSLMTTGAADNAIYLWDNNFQSLGNLIGHTAPIRDIAFTPEGTQLIAADDNGRLIVWDLLTRTQVNSLANFTPTILDLSFHPELPLVASGYVNGELSVWNVEQQILLSRVQAHATFTRGVEYSPNGELLATTGSDIPIHIWNRTAQNLLHTIERHDQPVLGIAFSPDSTTIASASADRNVRLTDIETGAPLGNLSGHEALVVTVDYSPDGRFIASGGNDNTIRLWDARSATAIRIVGQHDAAITSVAFSCDGRHLASGARDGTIKIWDLQEQTLEATFTTNFVWELEYSPDGRLLYSAHDDHLVRVWDTVQQNEIIELQGHTEPVRSVTVSPDGKLILSGGLDGTIRVWGILE